MTRAYEREVRKPYHTLEQALYYEADPIKGSRFYVNAAPVSSEYEAKQVLEAASRQFPHARHHCWALTLRSPSIARPNDDGEPSGSAGKPILAQLQGRDLLNTIVVVSRFFGGTKLGVGGLVRAYGGAAGAALDTAQIIQVVPKTTVQISFSYAHTSLVEAALANLNQEPDSSKYGEQVELSVLVEDAQVESFIHRFREQTAHKVAVRSIQPSS